MATAASLATIQKAYVAYYGRPADPLGLAFWADQLDAANGNLDAIINAFGTSAEATEIYGKLSFAAAVNALYQQQFGRDAELDGLKFYVDGLQKGTFTLASLALNIADGASGADLTALTSKLQAADAFTAAINTTAEVLGYSGDAAAAAARAQLAAVKDAASLAAFNADSAVSAVVDAGVAPAPGQTFTLTTAVGENIVGTAGNDTFSAVVGTGGTLNIGDQINGGAGTDTLNLLVADGATAIPAGASTSNIEIVNINYVGAAAGDIIGTPVTAASFAGVQQLWQIDNVSGANATFQDVTVAAAVTAGFRSTNVTATAVDAAVTVAAAGGTQTALNVALDGVGHGSALTFDGAGVKTINVSGSVAAQAAGNAGDLGLIQGTSIAETINLTATSAVDLLTLDSFTTLKTLDASGTTGAIRANATNGADIDNSTLVNLASVKLGSGNDNVLFTLGGDKALTINAGAGNDTIALTGTVADGNVVTVSLGAGRDVLVVDGALANLGAGVSTVAELVERVITVTDFSTAEDVLNLNGSGGIALTSAQLAAVSGAADLLAAVTQVAALVGANGSAVFGYGNDAYVFANDGTAALGTGDALIQLVGVDASEFTNIQNGNLVLA